MFSQKKPKLFRSVMGRKMHLELLEDRVMLASDIYAVDGRSVGANKYFFHVEENTISWGDQIHIDFAIGNRGDAASSGKSFDIDFLLASNSGAISTSSYKLGTMTGVVVPPQNQFAGYTVTIVLPASNPVGPGSGFGIGMYIDFKNVIPESSESNNINLGINIDKTDVFILPPVALVTDSFGSSTDHAINFGTVVADGSGNSQVMHTVALSDSAARSLLKVGVNGVQLANGTNFKIANILSNKLSQSVNVAGGSSLIAAANSEVWTIQVAFDPVATGSSTDTLIIQTDDPSNPTIDVALTGIGNPVSRIEIVDSLGASNDQTLDFGDIGLTKIVTANIMLTNTGTGPLTVNKDGLSLPPGPFTITSITSSTQGAISLASGSKTIASAGAETWTIGVQFNPTGTGQFQIPLSIASDDTIVPTTFISLYGNGKVLPQVSTSATSLAFGSVYADGARKEIATRTFTIQNPGQLPAIISQNGMKPVAGTHFRITGIVSSTKGAVNLIGGSATLAANNSERWTITVVFDPLQSGSLNDSLQIVSNAPNSPTNIALSGTGLNQTNLTASSTSVTFPNTLADGNGGSMNVRYFTLKNNGTQPLLIPQNGLTIGGTVAPAGPFKIYSITSNTKGAIQTSLGQTSLAPLGAETWTIGVSFDPTVAGSAGSTLGILNNDPNHTTFNIALNGKGVIPSVTSTTPAQNLRVSAGSPYKLTWNGVDSVGTGTYSLYYDTDRNPTTGLVQIASGLPFSRNSFDWQVPKTLVGQTVTINVKLTDGSLSAAGYASGSIGIDAVGTDRLLSAPITDQAQYTLRYAYKGITYAATSTLVMGDNTLFAKGGGATHEYHVFRVPSLVDAESTSYDSLGNITSTTDSAGQVTSYAYDMLSRLTRATYADGNVVDYTYDPSGNLLTMHDSTGWQIFQYDILNRLTAAIVSPTNNANDPSAIKLAYEYDQANRLTAVTYPSGKRIEYAYTNGGKMSSVTEKNSGQANLVTSYVYSGIAGLLTSVTRPNDTQTVYSYDTAGRLVDILHRRTSTQALVLQFHYTLDAAGRKTLAVRSDASGTTAQAYAYDDLNRLSQVTYSDNNGTIEATDKVVRYTFDSNGNRLTQTTYATGVANGATETLTYAYTFENRLLTVTDQNAVVQERYAYDQRGNQVEKVTPTTTTLYGYDSRNLLISVDDGTNHTTYQYDGAGRRVSQSVNGVVTQFVNDPTGGAVYQTVEERNGSGTTQASYVYGLDRLAGYLPGQTNGAYYLSDNQGSVGSLTTNTGSSLGNYTYDAYGKTLTNTTGTTNPFQYDGERLDQSTGLIDLRARSYDSTTGRFLQKDPSGMVDGPSRYVYAQASPTTGYDPSGLETYVGKDGIVYTTEVHAQIHYDDMPSEKGSASNSNPFGASSLDLGLAVGARIRGVGVFGQLLNTHIRADGQKSLTLIGGTVGPLTLDVNAPITNQGKADLSKISYDPKIFGIGGSDNFNDIHASTNAQFGIGGTIDLNLSKVPIISNVIQAIQAGISRYGIDSARLYSDTTQGGTNTLISSSRTAGEYFGARFNPGGVLIDKAATLVNQNLKDIAGATFDPTTHQLVFLGNSNPAAVQDVNLDLFTTAVNIVYGSDSPPFVTLDPPAKLVYNSFTFGSDKASGLIPAGQTAYLPIHYTPYAFFDGDNMSLSFTADGQQASVGITGYIMSSAFSASGRTAMGLTLGNVTGLPAGINVSMPPKNPSSSDSGYSITLSASSQDSIFYVGLCNTTASSVTINGVQLSTSYQHRKISDGADNTKFGWIIEEADRVMKELAIGKDQLTGTIYSSMTPGMPAGFENVIERAVALHETGATSSRFWFTPDVQALKRYVDSSGTATVLFDTSTVKLNTESNLLGQPSNAASKSFADYFNANYDSFAAMTFPVHDPSNISKVINVKIFSQLRDAMKAVSLARFFHDNDIPLDTWWISSQKLPVAQVPKFIPTLSNSVSSSGLTFIAEGGVTILTPNSYVPDVVAQSIAAAVVAQRPGGTGDIQSQSWTTSTSTSYGSLTSVAVTLDSQQQSQNISISSSDISLPSPGGNILSFSRFYNSGVMADHAMGPGWQPVGFELQFQKPSLLDELGILRDSAGNKVRLYNANKDTLMRMGELRIYDHSSGSYLNFYSSLKGVYSLGPNGNPIYVLSGLNASGVPDFTSGDHHDGSTLTQDPISKQYSLIRPDGSIAVFMDTGDVIQLTDRRGYTQTYNWNFSVNPSFGKTKFNSVSDSAGQKIVASYSQDGHIAKLIAYDSSGNLVRGMSFSYDSQSRLILSSKLLYTNVTSTGQTVATTTYNYDLEGRIQSIVGPDGITKIMADLDDKGRTTARQDNMDNVALYSFTRDISGINTTQAVDIGVGIRGGVLSPPDSNAPISLIGNDATAQGTSALKYFPAGATTAIQSDALSRVTQIVDAIGNTTKYGYAGNALAPTSVTLPVANRPTITIQRNSANLPTVINDPANIGGQAVQITYTSANKVDTQTDARGLVTKFKYTAWNDVESVIVGYGTALAETTQYVYNTGKLLDHVIDPLGHTVVTYGYDSFGRVKSVTDGDGVVIKYEYDSFGRVQKIFDPSFTGTTNYTLYAYNSTDQVTTVTTPTGTNTTSYDPTTHRITSTINITGSVTNYGYDAASGLLTSVTQVSSGGNATTQYVYDRLGQLAALIAPRGQHTAFRHDKLGRSIATIEDNGQLPKYTGISVTSSGPQDLNVAFDTSESVVVASLKYWLDGQLESTAQTTSQRISDKMSVSFNLHGVSTSARYHYTLALTDSTGHLQISPVGSFVLTLPATTISLVTGGNIVVQDMVGRDDRFTISGTANGITITDQTTDPDAIFAVDTTLLTQGAVLAANKKSVLIPITAIQATGSSPLPLLFNTGAGNDAITLITGATSDTTPLPLAGFMFDFGTGTDSLIVSGPTDNTWNLTGTQSGNLQLQNGTLGTAAFSGLENILGSAGIDTFNLTNALTANGFVKLDGGAGALDKLTVARNTATNYSLSDSQLSIDSSGVNLDQTFQLANIKRAYLTGSKASDTFDVSGWTSGSTIAAANDFGGILAGGGGTGIDTVIKKADIANFIVADTVLTADRMKLKLQGGIRVRLEDSGPTTSTTFDVTDYSRPGSLKGSTVDANIAQQNKLVIGTASNPTTASSLTIKNQQYAIAGKGIVTMLGINSTSVVGGSGPNTVKYRNFGMTGSSTFDGGGGNDTLDIDCGFTPNLVDSLTLSDSQAVVKKGATPVITLNLASVENAAFVGTDPTQSANKNPNTVDLSAWSGSGSLILGDGPTDKADVLLIDHATRTTAQTFAFDATGLNITDGTNASHKIQLKGVDNVSLLSGSGNDFFDATNFTCSLTVNAGDGNNVIIGGSGNDVLTAGAGNDWISGNDGNDTITGGEGKNVLVGGRGVDTITGGSSADLITGGITSFDKNTGNNKAIIDAILAAWSNASSVPTAVQQLSITGLSVGGQTIKLTTSTVSDDGLLDTILAGPPQDWLFLQDKNKDGTPGPEHTINQTGGDVVTDLL